MSEDPLVKDLNRSYECALFQSLGGKKKNNWRGIDSFLENLSEAHHGGVFFFFFFF